MKNCGEYCVYRYIYWDITEFSFDFMSVKRKIKEQCENAKLRKTTYFGFRMFGEGVENMKVRTIEFCKV